MGIFGKLFGNKNDKEESNEEKEIFYAQQDDKMEGAYLKAQQTFKYFWRELYWEYRRIIPAQDLAIVKIPFKQKVDELEDPIVEHMWINEINFDGEKINGVLMNAPNELTNIAIGDSVSVALNEISDWMLAIQGKTYGGYTIQVLRSNMSEKERKNHDNAWGLDFGDFNYIQVLFEQKEHPENLVEHPMAKNMADQAREFFKENPNEIMVIDENGNNMLHRESIAGNKTTIDILLELGADKTIKNKKGKNAFDYAKQLNWEHIVDAVEN